MKTINLKPTIGIILFFSLVLLITVSCKKEKSVFALADFSFSGNTIALPAVVQFTNKSFGLSYVWDFGDGSSSKA
jgi:PKD repeat protein